MTLQAEFRLPGCVPAAADAVADIHIRLRSGPPPPSTNLVFAWPGRYGLSLHRHPDGWLMSTRDHGSMFVTRDGGEVLCYPDGASSHWTDILMRRVVPRVMQSRGRLLLHAGCVSDGVTGCLLFGPTGIGKSTLTATLALNKSWEILNDDLAILDPTVRPLVCHPSSSGLCLWPDSVRGVGADMESMRHVAGHEEKRWHEGTLSSELRPRPLGALVFLTDLDAEGRPASGVEVSPLAPAETARRAFASLTFFDPTDRAARERAWTDLATLVAAAPSFLLAYPRQYSVLPTVRAALESTLSHRARPR